MNFSVSTGVVFTSDSVIVFNIVYFSSIGQNFNLSETGNIFVESKPFTIELYTDGYSIRSD